MPRSSSSQRQTSSIRVRASVIAPAGSLARRSSAASQRACTCSGSNRARDRKSVVWGKSVSVRVDLGGRRIIKKKQITIDYIHIPNSLTESAHLYKHITNDT